MSYAEFALIRFGSGRSPRYAGPDGPNDLMQSLQDDTTARQFHPIQDAEAAQLAIATETAQRALRLGEGTAEAEDQAKAALNAAVERATRVRLARAVDDPTGFADRLVQFWSSHFSLRLSTANLRILAASFQETLRRHQQGRFAELLQAATLHPAMLIYLDQTSSVGPNSVLGVRQKQKKRPVGLNENHARELLELHSMGVAASFSQDDVRQLAELMTGLSVTKDKGFSFETRLVEPGAETVLGHEYGGRRPASVSDFTAFLDDLALRPETARFICTKLARHFCADSPPAALVDDMVARYRDSGGMLSEVYDLMVRHPLARESFGQKVRQPQDLLAASLRALQIDGAQIVAWPDKLFLVAYKRPMDWMGQNVLGAQQPQGWPESAEAWLTPQLLAYRIGWAMAQPRKLLKELPDPRQFATDVLYPDVAATVADVAARAESRADGVGLVLASPQFNRR